MDVQAGLPRSTYFSLEDALEKVSQDLVYDPTTKQLCIRSQTVDRLSDRDSDSNLIFPSKLTFSELRKQSDSDSGYCGLSSDCNTENNSQKSISETQSDTFPNEDVDDLDLSIDSPHEFSIRSTKSKLLFFQLAKLTSSANSNSSGQLGISKKSSHSSISSIARNAFADQPDSIIDDIDDNALCLGKRPFYLPPKSDEELRRHQVEFKEILKQAKKRGLKEIKLKKRILSKQIRQEEEISGAIRCWTNDILPAWPSSRGVKRTRELWWSGIPSPVRPKVWSLAIGNELRITAELFRICVERSRSRIWTKQFVCRRSSNPYPSSSSSIIADKHHRRVASQPIVPQSSSACVDKLSEKLSTISIKEGIECAKTVGESEDEEDSSESIAFLIKLDVSRTFPQLGLFQENGPLHQSLSDVLAAYAVFRPDTSYCQGMSFLAAMLLLNLDSAASAFTAFSNMLNNELLLVFYRLLPDKMRAVYDYYDRQMQALLPRLANHLRAIGLTTDLFFVDQIYTLFSRCLPLECACRVWDLYLRDGDEFIFRASLGLLLMHESILLNLEFAEAAQLLAHLPEDMDTDQYFRSIDSIKLVAPKLWQPIDHMERLDKNLEPNTSFVKKLFPF